jgi:alanyl-tRNA synthetase
VTARRTHRGQPAVVLDRTAFYAESGGQPWDQGRLGDVPVLAVVYDGGDVLHVLARELPGDAVHGQVDGGRRRDHLQQHHGQHLLSRAFVEVAQARTVGFHLGAEESSIDLDRAVTEDQGARAEALANEVVWGARPVRVEEMTRAEAVASGLDPAEQAGDRIRVVEAAGFDRQPCSGTHPRSTAEVGVVAVTGHERYKAGTRVRFVCGRRAVLRARRDSALLARLGAALSAPPEALPEAVARLQAQLAAARAEGEGWLGQLAMAEADRLATRAEGGADVVAAVYPGWSADALRRLAQALTARRPVVALLAGVGERTQLVFAQSEGLPHDVPALLREACAALGGRGGGRGNLAQGGSDRTEGVAEVLGALAARIRSAS